MKITPTPYIAGRNEFSPGTELRTYTCYPLLCLFYIQRDTLKNNKLLPRSKELRYTSIDWQCLLSYLFMNYLRYFYIIKWNLIKFSGCLSCFEIHYRRSVYCVLIKIFYKDVGVNFTLTIIILLITNTYYFFLNND